MSFHIDSKRCRDDFSRPLKLHPDLVNARCCERRSEQNLRPEASFDVLAFRVRVYRHRQVRVNDEQVTLRAEKGLEIANR